MTHAFFTNNSTQNAIKSSADILNQAIIGMTNYVDKSQSLIGNTYQNASNEFTKQGKMLTELTRDYFKAAQDILSKQQSPQAQRVAQDIAAVNRPTAK